MKKTALLYAFVDRDKASDRVPSAVGGWPLRKLGVEEWLVQGLMIMYDIVMRMAGLFDLNHFI